MIRILITAIVSLIVLTSFMEVIAQEDISLLLGKNVKEWHAIGSALISEGRHEESIKYYDKILENDTFNFIDLDSFSPGKSITLEIVHHDGSNDVISLSHTYNAQQIEWFKEGSALNLIRKEINN